MLQLKKGGEQRKGIPTYTHYEIPECSHLIPCESKMENKQSVDYYMSLPYTIHVERSEVWGYVSYTAYVVEFPNCEVTQGTEEDARREIRRTMRTWILTRLQLNDMPIPMPN